MGEWREPPGILSGRSMTYPVSQMTSGKLIASQTSVRLEGVCDHAARAEMGAATEAKRARKGANCAGTSTAAGVALAGGLDMYWGVCLTGDSDVLGPMDARVEDRVVRLVAMVLSGCPICQYHGSECCSQDQLRPLSTAPDCFPSSVFCLFR